MCEYRTGYPIVREDGVIFLNPERKLGENVEVDAIEIFEVDSELSIEDELVLSLLTGGV